ncbi:MAG: hypothetical protein EKK34_07085 [Mycobacterium sp.]|nr:MAG: hypothetical protein EKK34_07085 [Mycobacterium sp.]
MLFLKADSARRNPEKGERGDYWTVRIRQESTGTTTTTIHGGTAREDKAQLDGLLHAVHYKASVKYDGSAQPHF